ncbi:uncharacterized protein MONBRDRAFT_2538, partial [Monosiga brevicollis MX1]
LLMQFIVMILDRIFYLKRSMRGKLLVHVVTVIGLHIYIFFVLPIDTNRSFPNNGVLVFIYILYLAYWIFSSMQLRTGYPNFVLGNFLTRSVSIPAYLVWVIYRAVPFMHEIRVLLDWTFTPTISQFRWWQKVDAIYHQLYKNRYFLARKKVTDVKRGGYAKKQAFGPKLGGGFLFSLGLLIVIWLPLILMAAFSSQTASNLPDAASITVALGENTPPFYS